MNAKCWPALVYCRKGVKSFKESIVSGNFLKFPSLATQGQRRHILPSLWKTDFEEEIQHPSDHFYVDSKFKLPFYYETWMWYD